MLISEFFKDKQGNIVIAQRPNAPLRIWYAASVVRAVSRGPIRRGAQTVATGALVVWACEELFDGDSPFRRTIGFLTLLGMLSPKI
ncbi:MAG: hypothetical protein U0105_02670 [Candidatus Obscuribacterales bacterium]